MGALTLLEQLQHHENNEVYKHAEYIIETYFNDVRVIFNIFH